MKMKSKVKECAPINVDNPKNEYKPEDNFKNEKAHMEVDTHNHNSLLIPLEINIYSI